MSSRLEIAEIVLLAAWLGAVGLFGAVVAPAAFAALPSRALAGAVVGRVLPPLFITGMLTGAAVVASGAIVRSGAWRPLAGAALVLSCAISHLVIGSRIGQLRLAIGPSLDALAPNDPRRVLFGRLHAMSVAGLGVGVVAAAAGIGLAAAALSRSR